MIVDTGLFVALAGVFFMSPFILLHILSSFKSHSKGVPKKDDWINNTIKIVCVTSIFIFLLVYVLFL